MAGSVQASMSSRSLCQFLPFLVTRLGRRAFGRKPLEALPHIADRLQVGEIEVGGVASAARIDDDQLAV